MEWGEKEIEIAKILFKTNKKSSVYHAIIADSSLFVMFLFYIIEHGKY